MTELNKPFSEKYLTQSVSGFLSERQLENIDWVKIDSAAILAENKIMEKASDSDSYYKDPSVRTSVYYATAKDHFPNDYAAQHALLSRVLPNKQCFKAINITDKDLLLENIVHKFKLMKINYLQKNTVNSYLTDSEVAYLRKLLNYFSSKGGFKEDCLPFLINKINILVYNQKKVDMENSEIIKTKSKNGK